MPHAPHDMGADRPALSFVSVAWLSFHGAPQPCAKSPFTSISPSGVVASFAGAASAPPSLRLSVDPSAPPSSCAPPSMGSAASLRLDENGEHAPSAAATHAAIPNETR